MRAFTTHSIPALLYVCLPFLHLLTAPIQASKTKSCRMESWGTAGQAGARERDIKHPHNFTVQIRELRLSDVGDLVWSHTLGLCGASSAQPSPDCVLGALPYTALGRSGGRTHPESCFPSSGTLASHLSCKPGAKGHCSTCSKK